MNPNNPNFRTADEWFALCGKQAEEIAALKADSDYYKKYYLDPVTESREKEITELKRQFDEANAAQSKVVMEQHARITELEKELDGTKERLRWVGQGLNHVCEDCTGQAEHLKKGIGKYL